MDRITDPDEWVNDPRHPWLEDSELLERWVGVLARTVAIDFDGVIHPYSKGWTGSMPDDEAPTPGCAAFLAALKKAGFRIVVFSTRANHSEGLDGILTWLERWGLSALVDSVTHEKPAAVAYVDDRAVPYAEGNWDDCRRQIDRLANGRAHGAAPVTGRADSDERMTR